MQRLKSGGFVERVMGLDIGTNSVGWAVIDVPEGSGEPGGIVAIGSRVFPAGAPMRGASSQSPAAVRRAKRSMRRQIRRRAARKATLRRALRAAGLWPADAAHEESLLAADPAALLAKCEEGLELSPGEIGRIIYWLASRRGFLSLRSGADVEPEDEEPDFVPKRTRADQERLLLDLWKIQQEHHPGLLTNALLYGRQGPGAYPTKPQALDGNADTRPEALLEQFGVHGLVFFQRAVYWRPGSVGRCPVYRWKSRARRADRVAQQFRIETTLANIRIGPDKRPLTAAERDTLRQRLMRQGTVAASAARKALGLDADTFASFDRGNDSKLRGHETDAALRKALGKECFERLTESSRDHVVELLLSAAAETLRIPQLMALGLTRDEADTVLDAASSLPKGRAAYSRAAMRRMIPFLLTGADETTAKQQAFGASVIAGYRDEPTSPLVKRALHETMQVVKAVLRDYGPPDVIRVELARDVSLPRKIREEIERQQRSNEKQREVDREWLKEQGQDPTRDLLERVRLWRKQQQLCLYTGTPITVSKLFTGTEVDHIVPRSLTLDNAQTNKALVLSAENQDKGDRTVGQWLRDDPAKHADIIARAKAARLPRRLIAQLETVDPPADAIAEALKGQTGHVTRQALQELRTRYPDIPVQVSNGRLTAQVRGALRLGKPERDYRRHALDAAMIAITDRSAAFRLAKEYKRRASGARAKSSPVTVAPWSTFRDDLFAALDSMAVSHKILRRHRGPLHEETYYGRITAARGTRVARRRRIEDLNAKRLSQVADPVVKLAVTQHLLGLGIDPGTLKTGVLTKANPPLMPGSDVPILRVRCHLDTTTMTQLRESDPRTYVEPGNNLLARAWDLGGKWRIEVLPLWDVVTRRDPAPADPEAKLMFTVGIGDILALDDEPAPTLWKVRALDRESGRIELAPHWLEPREAAEKIRASARTLRSRNARKVTVTRSGLLRRAND